MSSLRMHSVLENNRILVGALASVLLLSACEKKEMGPPHVRGKGMALAALSVPQQSAVNAAAVSAAFDREPSLSLLADPVYLPRTSGRHGGASVAPALVARMKEQGLVRGTCQTPREGARAVPLCPAAIPGYVVRFSEIFRTGESADSVEVNLVATRYRSAPKEAAEVLEFERAYQLVRVRGEWRVMREARLPKTLQAAIAAEREFDDMLLRYRECATLESRALCIETSIFIGAGRIPHAAHLVLLPLGGSLEALAIALPNG